MNESDAELIERARRAADERLQDEYSDYEAGSLLLDLADRIAALTTPEPWRSPSEPPAIFELVFVRIGKDCVEIGYHTKEYLCGWADRDGRVLCGVTGWKPIIRPAP